MIQKNKKTDETLMQLIGKGDADAFTMLVRRHLDRVFSICYRRLGNKEEAEEAAQEVFISIWKSAARWHPSDAKFTTWLYRVSVNKCTDILRRRKPTLPLENIDEPIDLQDDGFVLLSKKKDRDLIFEALNKLSQAQRDAIEMVYFAEMGQKAAAETLGVSIAALESSLRRGRKKLHQTLKRHRGYFAHFERDKFKD